MIFWSLANITPYVFVYPKYSYKKTKCACSSFLFLRTRAKNPQARRQAAHSSTKMTLVNAFQSLSLAAPAGARGLGFKKAVAAFAMPARVSASRSAVFEINAKQNKKARTMLVSAVRCGVCGSGCARRGEARVRSRRACVCGVCVTCERRRRVGDEAFVVAGDVVLLPAPATSSSLGEKNQKPENQNPGVIHTLMNPLSPPLSSNRAARSASATRRGSRRLPRA